MPAPTIYRSSDLNAPILNAGAGTLVNVLGKVLVDGYGSTPATGTVTTNGTNVSAGDTVTVDSITYTFRAALTPLAGEVLIGASAAASLANLAAAIGFWPTPGTNYAAATAQQPNVMVSALSATVLTVQAFTGGAGGNALALAKSAATLTVSGATLAGGGGANTIAALGWGRPFTALNKASFRAASGVRHYLDIDDSAPGSTAIAGRSAALRGYETMSAVGTGTGSFPTTTQVAAGSVAMCKSALSDPTNRPWLIIGDGLTFYMFSTASLTNPPTLSSNFWGQPWGFGEFFSALSGDLYRSILLYPSGAGAISSDAVTAFTCLAGTGTTTTTNQNCPRAYFATGSAIWLSPYGNPGPSGSSTVYNLNQTGVTGFPNPVDGGCYIAAIDLVERGSGTTPVAASASNGFRGRLRGIYQVFETLTNFNDEDTFSGVGDFAGMTFMVTKWVSASAGGAVMQTTTWAASS